MKRKDCEVLRPSHAKDGVHRPLTRGVPLAWVFAVTVTGTVFLAAAPALGASVRVWPSAVVVDDQIRLGDLCDLSGFATRQEQALRELIIAEAPVPGGSRVIHIEMIRSAMVATDANMATTRIGGAMRCAVARPLVQLDKTDGGKKGSGKKATRLDVDDRNRHEASSSAARSGAVTLRHAVIDFFNAELARFGGKAEVIFDRTSDQVLDLSGPTYSFTVRRRGGPMLGLTSLEVDVRAGGQSIQVVPLAVRVSMMRGAVVARRSINQGATIGASDIQIVAMSFTRLDKLGLDDSVQAVGQRAKRFIPSGALIEPPLLESVPLVLRGQLVTLVSTVGGVRVVTTGKVAADGLLGERVAVRVDDKRRGEMDGVVTGPGEVRLGSGLPLATASRFSMKVSP